MILIYNFVTWFTECPYFNLVSSICGILSALTLVNILYFIKAKPKINPAKAQEVIDILLNYNNLSFFRIDHTNINDFPDALDLNSKNVNYGKSFLFPVNDIWFAIVKTDVDLRLYANLAIESSTYQLIATDKTNPKLNEILQSASKVNNLTNEQFVDQILKKIRKN